MGKKSTKTDFINKANEAHNNIYDYSFVEYINSRTNVKIICKKHGIFELTPNNHLSGRGCPECSKIKIYQKFVSNKDEFILKASKKHNNKYDYSLVKYINSKTPIIIICPIHGNFEQIPSAHLSGRGCKYCANNINSTTEFFIVKANKIHNNKYNYSKVIYTNCKSNITIICPIHGEFEQTPTNHLRGTGCPKCVGKYIITKEEFLEKINKIYGNKYDYSDTVYVNSETKLIVYDEIGFKHMVLPNSLLRYGKLTIRTVVDKNKYFIKKANDIHNNKYDYSKINYIDATTNVIITCPIHGEYEQTPNKHLSGRGCPKCSGFNLTHDDFIKKANDIHNNKYDYSKVIYINGNTKINIICIEHGLFEQTPSKHLNGQGCPKCSSAFMNTELFISKAIKIHGNIYNYSKVIYTNCKSNVTITCPIHGDFEQIPSVHLSGSGCKYCANNVNSTTEFFIVKANKIHNNKYNYSKVMYTNCKSNVTIICPIHGEFEQSPSNHLAGRGCSKCYWSRGRMQKLNLLNTLEFSDLLTMDSIELSIIIGQGNLPNEFKSLLNSDANSEERITTLKELKKKFETEEETTENTNQPEDLDFTPTNDIDSEITTLTETQKQLPTFNYKNELHSLDNTLYATMDEEAFESLIQYKLKKLWHIVLNNKISISEITDEQGGKYFTLIKNRFLAEYYKIIDYTPPGNYSFKHQPNLMQKLTVNRLLENKNYGNFSGTGAGKTLSFIIASREIDSRLTIIVALNSTIKQTTHVIKEVYPDSVIFTDYKKQKFDLNKHNYLVLNYEKFQQNYSEELYQHLTINNKIDFVVIDEVQNAKQRNENEETIRRSILNRMLGRIRENNPDSYTLVMSATPVVNNLQEAKSLLQLMTGLDYDDLNIRSTIPNAINVFKQLIINSLRFIPQYDINIRELTGQNTPNLSVDGNHLLDELLSLPKSNYLDAEKLLLETKLNSLKPYLKKGMIIYSYFTTDIINKIEKFISEQGFTFGTYTGEEDTFVREKNLNNFISGKIDILIGSQPIATGVDGLQEVCDRLAIITLPWTDSAYQQLKGRIYRQGSNFKDVEIIIPQIRIDLDNDDFWSWDIQRMNLIRNKRTLADAAVDGLIPSKIIPSPETLFKKSQESLQNWKDRINSGNIIHSTRDILKIDLYPEIDNEEIRQCKIESELSEFNRKGKTTLSSTMNKLFNENPNSWFRYHALRSERMKDWNEIPYEYIATKIKNKNHKVVDFGCGENKMKDCIPDNKVFAFDHIACDESVIACDTRDISKYIEDLSVDVAVFSLSLWGVNYKEYISEAYRILNYGGIIHIAEPLKNYETTEDEQKLINLIGEVGFTIVGGLEKRSKFIYITGIKM